MYACESKVVTPSKVDPNCVPTSVVVEKPTGEFGVNLDAEGKAPLVLFLLGINILSVSSFNIFEGDWKQRRIVLESFSNSVVGLVNADV